MRDIGNGNNPFGKGNSLLQNDADSGCVSEFAPDPELRSLLLRHAPQPSSKLDDRIMSSYAHHIRTAYLFPSRVSYRTWRFALIAVLAAALVYAAIRVGGYSHSAGTAKAPGLPTNQEPAFQTPEHGPGADAIFTPSGKAPSGGPGSVVSGRQTAGTPSATIPAKAVLDMGGPIYVPISMAIPEDPASSGDYTVKGVVTSEQGDPLPGATVSIYTSRPAPPKFEWIDPVVWVTCDAEGRYTLRLQSTTSNMTLVVQKKGFVTMEELLWMTDPGTVVRNYALPAPVACAEGRVFAGDSKPLAGATVRLEIVMSGRMKPYVSLMFVTTDASGGYKLPGLPAASPSGGGFMGINAGARGFFEDASRNIQFQAGPCEQVDFHLTPAKIVTMKVKDRQGALIPTASGTLVSSEAIPGRYFLIHRESADTLECPVPPDAASATCTIYARGYKSVTFPLDLNAPPAEVVLLEAEDAISGTVVSEAGKPVAKALVNVTGTRKGPGDPPPVEGSVETDANGRFVMPLSYPPVSRIKVTKAGYAEKDLTFPSQPVPPALEIKMQFQRAGIFGKVLDSEHRPVKWFSIGFRELEANGYSFFGRNFRSEDGEFFVSDIPAGVYALSIRPDAMTDPPKDRTFDVPFVEIRKGYLFGPLEIHLPPWETKK